MAFGFRSKMLLSALVPALTACAASETAGSDPGAKHDCFDVQQVTGYETIDQDTIKVRAGVSDEYLIDLEGGQCNTVQWTQALAIESIPSSWICTGRDRAQGNIYFREPGTSRRIQCYIEDVRRALTEPPHR